jgi:hypothetical protein
VGAAIKAGRQIPDEQTILAADADIRSILTHENFASFP